MIEIICINLAIAVIIIFSAKLLLRYVNCSLVDIDGKKILSPPHRFVKDSFYNTVIKMRMNKAGTEGICNFLNRVGDGNMVGVKLSDVSIVIVATPDLAKTILSGHHTKFPKSVRYNRLKFAFGEGLVTSKGKTWQAHRHTINPGFHAEALKAMTQTFIAHGHKTVQRWKDAIIAGKTEIDVCKEMNATTLDIICETGFGYRLKGEYDTLSQAITYVLEEMLQRFIDPTDWWPKLFPARQLKTKQTMERIHGLIDDIIKERLAKQQLARDSGDFTAVTHDLLDILLSVNSDDASTGALAFAASASSAPGKSIKGPSAGVSAATAATSTGGGGEANNNSASSKGHEERVRMSPSDIRDHAFTFLLAGHETTASTLMWIIYELCRHPDIQEKCHDEVVQVMNNRAVKQQKEDGLGPRMKSPEEEEQQQQQQQQQVFCYEDIQQCVYLTAVMKESLRLHPVVALLTRICEEETKLGQYRIPKGTVVSVCTMAMHRHPDHWVQPLAFRPERFLPENINNTLKHPFQYVPFSAGPRNCIGQRFSQMELVVLLAMMVSRFKFSMTEEQLQSVRFEETITFHPANLKVNIELRK